MTLFQGRSKFVVVIKGKPIPCGFKFYVLSEAATGYIHYAGLHFTDKTQAEAETGTKVFRIVLDALQGTGLNDGITFLDQGYVVSFLAPHCHKFESVNV